jgi:L-fucose isomerase-like protein
MLDICLATSGLSKSPLKDPFIEELKSALNFKIIDAENYNGENCIFYQQTGGTEGIFLKLFPKIDKAQKIYLLASQSNNSLAASMEILSFLNNRGVSAEIIHGSAKDVIDYFTCKNAEKLGIIGEPSDWLIASAVDEIKLLKEHNIELIHIPLSEIYELMEQNFELEKDEIFDKLLADKQFSDESIKTSQKIFTCLHKIVEKYNLKGFSLRCFDLIGKYSNTGCLALSIFNSRGIIATCEGDLKTMISMFLAQKITGETCFMANPSRIIGNKLIFAHCTIPTCIVKSYTFDTHFESRLGIGIKGELPLSDITVFKFNPNNNQYLCFESKIDENLNENDLCRTQISLNISDNEREYFLNNPIGNHHLILLGKQKTAIEKYLEKCRNLLK